VQVQFALEAAAQQRHDGQHARSTVFQGPDEVFHPSNDH
jgi:hypothetical protein